MKKNQLPKDPRTARIIRQQLQGYKILNELRRKEDLESLPRLTPEESLQIYAGLCKVWEQTRRQHPDYRKLDRKRIDELVRRRRLFDKLAGG